MPAPAVAGAVSLAWAASARDTELRLTPLAAAMASMDAPEARSSTMPATTSAVRLGLLRARLALLDGDADTAAELATAVAGDAAGRGAGRYELLARALLGLADPVMPPERLSSVIEGLGRCAVMDGWPLVAALAVARRCDPWRAAARRLAATVVASAGTPAARSAVSRFVDARFTG